MNHAKSAGLLVILLSAVVPVQVQGAEQSPGPPGLLTPGQEVTLLGDVDGYVLFIGRNVPEWLLVEGPKTVAQNAATALAVAEADYKAAVAANQAAVGTIPAEQVAVLRSQWDSMREAYDQAKRKAARPDVWTIIQSDAEFIGLQSGETQLYLPLRRVKAVARPVPKK